MGITQDKCMINIDRNGNTTAATIPSCLCDYESQLRKGDDLILSAFGGGYTWGATCEVGLRRPEGISGAIPRQKAETSVSAFF